jgi:signal transduction histidine kinase
VRLRTRFQVTTAASLGAILALAAVLVYSRLESARVEEGVDLAQALMQGQYERALLRDEYLLTREARARKQWEQKTAALPALLSRASARFDRIEERQLIGEMDDLLERTTALFNGIALGDDHAAVDEPLLAQSAEPRLRTVATLRLAANDLYTRARQLTDLESARFHATQKRMTLALAAVFLTVLALTFLNGWMALATLERRVVLLRDGAEQVAAGNLGHRLDLQGNDELAELGNAFDRMTERLQQTYQSLESSNRELEAFSYAVSHDLRAPLRSVSGFSQAVLEDYGPQLDARGRQYLELANDGAREMGRLIDDLLSLSRVARAELVPRQVDLSALARSVIDDLRRADPGRQVVTEIADGLVAEGDPTLLGQVVDNLLRNAWKFTSGHATARITFGRTDSGGQQAFFVSDDGAGFDMAYVDKLFHPFQRLHRTSEFTGTGIGLATVYRIILRHGGAVRALGEIEKGATITFTLPTKEESHAEQGHPAGRRQPEGRAPDRAGLREQQDRERAPRGA